MTEEIKINEQATKAQLQRLREAVSAMQRAVEIYAKWFMDIVEEATRFSDDFIRLLAMTSYACWRRIWMKPVYSSRVPVTSHRRTSPMTSQGVTSTRRMGPSTSGASSASTNCGCLLQTL